MCKKINLRPVRSWYFVLSSFYDFVIFLSTENNFFIIESKRYKNRLGEKNLNSKTIINFFALKCYDYKFILYMVK